MVQLRKVVTLQVRRRVGENSSGRTHRQHEGPDGAGRDLAAGAGRSPCTPAIPVVEYSGGSTGASLALVCAAKGYRIQIVTSGAFSQDKLVQMAALGLSSRWFPARGGLTTKKLILDMNRDRPVGLSQQPHTYWTDQLNNHDSIAGYHALGEEIWSQTGGASTHSSTAWDGSLLRGVHRG